LDSPDIGDVSVGVRNKDSAIGELVHLCSVFGGNRIEAESNINRLEELGEHGLEAGDCVLEIIHVTSQGLNKRSKRNDRGVLCDIRHRVGNDVAIVDKKRGLVTGVL
jgi:hypothetical protein